MLYGCISSVQICMRCWSVSDIYVKQLAFCNAGGELIFELKINIVMNK